MTIPGERSAPDPNAEAIEAWNGPLFDRFLALRHILVDGLDGHGKAALALYGPRSGERVLDLGCGFGDTSQQIAALVGASGAVVGLDAAPRFIETARAETEALGLTNVTFEVADAQTDDLGGPFDVVFSRFGTMFFANPVVALRNVRRALRPGGRLVMVVWRRREDNPWLHRAQQIVETIVSRPEEYTEPTCGPGPFSMAGADTVSDVLLGAGFGDISLRRCERRIVIGTDIEEAIEVVTSLGPAGEILRLQGDRAAHLHETVRAALRSGLADFDEGDAVRAPASSWIVTASRA